MELVEELRTRVHEADSGMTFICHPLVHTMFAGSDTEIEIYNKSLEVKKEKLQQYRNEGRWESYIFLHEKPYRVEAFLDVAKHLSPERYWDLLGEVWTNSENIWQFNEVWRGFFTDERHKEFRHHFMSKKDRDLFESLPEKLTVYRGYKTGGVKEGMSFTLSRKTAKFFATRLCTSRCKSYVVEAKIGKDQIFAYKTDRGEDEIILLDFPAKSRVIPASKFKILGG